MVVTRVEAGGTAFIMLLRMAHSLKQSRNYFFLEVLVVLENGLAGVMGHPCFKCSTPSCSFHVWPSQLWFRSLDSPVHCWQNSTKLKEYNFLCVKLEYFSASVALKPLSQYTTRLHSVLLNTEEHQNRVKSFHQSLCAERNLGIWQIGYPQNQDKNLMSFVSNTVTSLISSQSS